MWFPIHSFVVFFLLLFAINNTALPQTTHETDSLITAIKQEHSITDKIGLYINLSKVYSPDSITRSIDIAHQALTLATQIDDNERTGEVHLLLGDLAMQMDSVIRAENEYRQAIKFLENSDSTDLLVRAMTSLGNRYVEKENYPGAMEQYLNGIRVLEQNRENKQLANLYNNIGVVYINMNNPKKALELYSKALSLFEQFDDTLNIAGTTTNIGSIYIQLGDYDIARDYYKNGYKLFKEINNKAGQAHALFKLGLLDELQHNNQGALEYLQRSLDIQRSMNIITNSSKAMFRSETDIHIGINYLELQDVKKAKNYLEEGLRIARQTEQYSLIALAAKHLSIIEKQNGNYQQALAFHELFKQYSDSTFNVENVRKLTQLEMQYQYESKLAHAKLEKELEIQKRKRSDLIYFVLTAGLLLFLIIIALLLKLERSKKKKLDIERERLEEKLDHTNKELTTHVMYLLRQNEFILSIIEKLKKARLDAKPENKKFISDLIHELKSNTDSVSWEEFEVRFQEVHTDFYTNIRKAFPDLSTNEIRMCAFFRLNMTSKEIAAITYQSLNSIKVARYRLRKKLKLSQGDNLISFLSKF